MGKVTATSVSEGWSLTVDVQTVIFRTSRTPVVHPRENLEIPLLENEDAILGEHSLEIRDKVS